MTAELPVGPERGEMVARVVALVIGGIDGVCDGKAGVCCIEVDGASDGHDSDADVYASEELAPVSVRLTF